MATLMPRCLIQAALVLLICVAPGWSLAQDAARGAQLYVQLPSGVPSCVSCHGPDPSQNRNNLLLAADRPATLTRVLNTVGAMGYLRDSLADANIADLSAYLGRVLVTAAPGAPLAMWPVTVELGRLPQGAAAPVHAVALRNLSANPVPLRRPELVGAGFLLSDDCPAELAPAAGCTVLLRALAAELGASVATLRLGAPAPAAPLLLGVSATVTAAPVGALSADPAQIDFGTQRAGERRTQDITLRSHGTAGVTLGVSTLTGPERGRFEVGGGCAVGTVLAPGSICVLQLSHVPAVEGSAQATLQWRSDGTNPGTVRVEGRASAAPVTPPDPAPPADVAGGGGCSVASVDRPLDPTLAILTALASAVLWRRRRRGDAANRPRQPDASGETAPGQPLR